MEAVDQVYRFGGFTLDIGRGILSRADGPTFLRPKAHALLTHLARNMGRIVPKDELMETVWPGVYVTEDSLTQSIREIRRTLGDELVRTVSKRGYMLAAEAEPAPEAATAQPVVAVLRFRNESADPADEAIVNGFAEDIINGLARFGTLTVLARNSSFTFASYDREEWPKIRARIGADYLVEGSVRRQGDRFMAAVNLIDAATASQIWGDRYQALDTGLFAIEREIVQEIVGRLVTKVNNAGLQRAAHKPATNLAAYELVLRGVDLLRDPAQSDLPSAEAFFKAAIAKDASYGLAYTYLALSRMLNAEFWHTDPAVLDAARELADRGAKLAPDQAECRRVQSLVRIYLREHQAAEHHLRMALELNPNDAECIEQMGFLLTMRGRPVDALGWLGRAIRINPLDPYWYEYDRALALYLMADYRLAADGLEQATRLTPWMRTRLAACYAQLGEGDKARRQMARIAEVEPGFSPIDYAKSVVPFEHSADAEHLTEGVMMALGMERP